MTVSLYGEVMGRDKAQVDSSPQVRAIISDTHTHTHTPVHVQMHARCATVGSHRCPHTLKYAAMALNALKNLSCT